MTLEARDDRSAGQLTSDERARLERAWRQRMLTVLAMLPAFVLVELLLDRVQTHHPTRHPAVWVLPLLDLVAVILLTGTVWWSRWMLFRPGRMRALLLSSDRRDRTRVTRKLRRRESLDVWERPVAQALVDVLPRQVPLMVGLTLVVLVGLALIVSTRRDGTALLATVLAVGMVTSAAWVVVTTRRSLAWAQEQGLRPRRTR